MNWGSWQDFFAMGGYALYVWGSVAMSVGLLAWELFALRRRRLAALKYFVTRGHGRKERDESAA